MTDSANAMALLAQLVVKQRVSLGGLTDDERRAALSLAWASLPWNPMRESEVNQALKAALTGAAQCLGTDHVELRRWLVDAGWLARDGYGREYRRLPATEVYVDNQPWAAVWATQDASAWVADKRQQHAAHRAQRRQRWEGGQQAA
jgi:Uncharacterized protein conserved in bacteria (DUF2087)